MIEQAHNFHPKLRLSRSPSRWNRISYWVKTLSLDTANKTIAHAIIKAKVNNGLEYLAIVDEYDHFKPDLYDCSNFG
jgi:hypothetical protein